MTKKNALKMLAFVAALAALGGLQAQDIGTLSTIELDPCMNGQVSTSGVFPTQAMGEQFARYLEWTAAEGLDVTFALEPTAEAITTLDPGANGSVSALGTFPTQAMEDQFHAYLAWTEASGLDVTYAFQDLGSN
ncbi:MAG: hypothetical protein LC667_07970 [Thioalkalivibrio sp.]|nr:hypothetical protein [Thioalkalivibrio sp.]